MNWSQRRKTQNIASLLELLNVHAEHREARMPNFSSAVGIVTSHNLLTWYHNDTGVKWCPPEKQIDTYYKEFYQIAQIITGLVIYPTAIFPGLVGNTLTIFVMSSRNMRTSTNAFLSALAVSDSIKLINDMLYFLVTMFLRTSTDLGNLAYGYLYPYAHFVFTMSVCVSSWLTVSVAVERYILVCHPTRARALWNRNRAVFLCVLIYFIMSCLALPSALRYQTIRCLDNFTNSSRIEVELTEIWQNKPLSTAYDWTQNFLRSIIPLLVLVVLNACIIAALRRTKAKRRKNSRHRVTIMMLVVILVFLVCITPDAILSTVFGFGYHEAGYLGKMIREFTDCLLTINASVNFLIYCAFNQVFRKSFARLCLPKNRKTRCLTELDESTYRRLSEAKSLLSSNNNSLHRQDRPSTAATGSSSNINSELAKEKAIYSVVRHTTSQDETYTLSTTLHSDHYLNSDSDLTAISSSSNSYNKHASLSRHPHHRRLPSRGLKKSRNSIKSSGANKEYMANFSDITNMQVESNEENQALYNTHSKTKSSLQTICDSSRVSHSSSDCEVVPDGSTYRVSDNPPAVTHVKTPNYGLPVHTCDECSLASFTVCDGSMMLTRRCSVCNVLGSDHDCAHHKHDYPNVRVNNITQSKSTIRCPYTSHSERTSHVCCPHMSHSDKTAIVEVFAASQCTPTKGSQAALDDGKVDQSSDNFNLDISNIGVLENSHVLTNCHVLTNPIVPTNCNVLTNFNFPTNPIVPTNSNVLVVNPQLQETHLNDFVLTTDL